jgi:hypothetical protein
MQQPENQNKKYQQLFTEIDCGRIKIPQFQRDFVWGKQKTAQLIDSIIKGYPIGTFILWKTRDGLRQIRNIGNVELPDIPKGDAAMYVLDGQQRITSLYAVRKGIIITRDGEEIDYKDICIDLSKSPDVDEELVLVEPPKECPFISVFKLLNGSLTELIEDYNKIELKLIENYQKRLTGYDFSVILIEDYPIDIACDVFTRINTGGQELSLFEIMVAKTYDMEREFDLAEKYDWLIDNKGAEKDLEDAGYDTIPPATVLQCISAQLCKQVRRRDILKIKKNDFIEAWEVTTDGLFAAVDYTRTHLRIPVSRLLPYHALLVPLTYFFIQTEGKKPTKDQHTLLTQYFYWASLSNRFSSAVESKIAEDLKKIDQILKREEPSYRGEEVAITLDELKTHWFSTGDAFCMGILCLLTYFEPKSFDTNSIVTLDNSWLKLNSSKNYHHFFPRAYLKQEGIPDWQANVILNITIVDDYLNKRKIGANAPSKYMRIFERKNADLIETMKTHLIDNLERYGIWEDDYSKFIEQRGKRVVAEIDKRLHPKL